jgi:MarR family transcriptional regulator, organic hydroperoxide resistance regulator
MKETDCIFFQIAKVNQIATRFLGQKVSSLNITPVQAMVLGFLDEEDQITSSELGKRTELDSATLTGILDRLETAKLIERQGNPDDRRSIRIHLTVKGKALSTEAAKAITWANKDFLAFLTETERRNLHSLIRKLRVQAVTD